VLLLLMLLLTLLMLMLRLMLRLMLPLLLMHSCRLGSTIPAAAAAWEAQSVSARFVGTATNAYHQQLRW